MPTKPAQDVVLPVGRTASLLGISAVTLRTWDIRYGVSPSARTIGRHRRYTPADIARIRRMQRLIDRGVAAQDAARLSADAPSGFAATVDSLVAAAEQFQFTDLSDRLGTALTRYGAARTWQDLVAPAFRRLEARFQQQHDCTDIELVLAGGYTAAVEQYVSQPHLKARPAQPVLLVPCPEERHTLALTTLRAVLLERGQSTVMFGPDASPVAVLDAIPRADPSAVVLWATIRRPGQAQLRRRIEATGRRAFGAGPGWHGRTRPLTTLAQAVDALRLEPVR
ncbi:MerR family transcriptional regulator [Kribbella sp. NPDC051587]|uniref:MerR family transcriptional regulator n=1 Tax=Kribbella sp. NPDC051587 TaxID=3364119 RepID=UPI003792EE58